jgi:DNA repair protein RadD
VRPASALECPECGNVLREPEEKQHRAASNAAVMLNQITAKIVTYPVNNVTYAVHKKEGSPDSLRVEYWSGMKIVAREWVCIEHSGFAGEKARGWWFKRNPLHYPLSTAVAFDIRDSLATPATITVNETGKYPEIIRFEFEQQREAA